jgi:two-component system, cell cycle response regulator DivK
MPSPFDGHSFSRVLGDAERLATGARDYERRLSELAGLLEQAALARLAAGPRDELFVQLRDLCVAAGEQRDAADVLVNRLAGDMGQPAPEMAKSPRVLIVDDAEDNRDLAAVVLEASGFAATTAGNGLEGLIVAHYADPAVVLMDIAMPVLGGIEATRLLKASSVTRHIPVLAYTATPITRDGWLAPLFTEIVRKPAEPQAIVAAVRRLAGDAGASS